MGLYVQPPDKNDGDTITGAEYNTLKNELASFLNQKNLGNINISEDPSERINDDKILFDGGSGKHGVVHEPGGVDKVGDIDILDTGVLLSDHAERHAAGGADPLDDDSITDAMLKAGAFGEGRLLRGKDRDANIFESAGLSAHNPKTIVEYDISPSGADPRGSGVVIGDDVYFAAPGASPDAVIKADFSTDPPTNTVIDLGQSDAAFPNGVVRIGADLYVLGGYADSAANCKIYKIVSPYTSSDVTVFKDVNADITPDVRDGRGLVRDSAGTALFFVAEVTTETDPDTLIRVSVPGGTVTKFDAGTGLDLSNPWVIKQGSVERVVLTDGRASSLNTLYRRNASDLAAVDSIQFPPGDSYQRIVYDGNHLHVINTAGVTVEVYNVWAATMFQAYTYTLPTHATLDFVAEVGATFFDGRYVWFGGRAGSSGAAIAGVPVWGVGGGISMRLRSDVSTVIGLATDGANLFVTTQLNAGGTSRIHKVPLF